jgi:hypothetical protein
MAIGEWQKIAPMLAGNNSVLCRPLRQRQARTRRCASWSVSTVSVRADQTETGQKVTSVLRLVGPRSALAAVALFAVFMRAGRPAS